MRTLLMTVLGILVSVSAYASYSCRDIPDLERVLSDLRSDCGGGVGSTPGGAGDFCRTKGYIGNTAEAAVAACSGSGTPFTRETCVSDLQCSGYATYCTAKGFLGNSAGRTIQACSGSSTPFTRETCAADLVCHGEAHFCRAKGFIGDSAEETVAVCSGSSTPYTRETCTNDLVCR